MTTSVNRSDFLSAIRRAGAPLCIAAATVMSCWSPDAAHAKNECGSSHFRYMDGGVSRTNIVVIRNSTCSIKTFIQGGQSGSNGIRSFSKSVSASNGVAGYANLNTITYRPNRDFTGSDFFSIIVEYDRSGTVTRTTLEVNVLVVPPK
jgi:hypothetical protein